MIIPAILEENFDAIRERMDTVRGLAEWVQIDLVDGVFAPYLTWPYTEGDPLDLLDAPDDLSIELHLMVSRPQLLVEKLIELPIRRVLFHLESFPEPDDLCEVFTVIDATQGMDAGIALKMQTPVEALVPFFDMAHTFQLVSIANIGVQGQPFDEGVYARIRQLRALAPDATIEIDGGVSLDNAALLIGAGADTLVVGSAIFAADDPHTAYEAFNAIAA